MSTKAERRRAERERIEALLLEGLESGESTEMTKKDWAELRRKALARLKAYRRQRKRGLD